VVEVIDGELVIYPIAETNIDEQRILDALRFVADGGPMRVQAER
jgi:hypothetical protein